MYLHTDETVTVRNGIHIPVRRLQSQGDDACQQPEFIHLLVIEKSQHLRQEGQEILSLND